MHYEIICLVQKIRMHIKLFFFSQENCKYVLSNVFESRIIDTFANLYFNIMQIFLIQYIFHVKLNTKAIKYIFCTPCTSINSFCPIYLLFSPIMYQFNSVFPRSLLLSLLLPDSCMSILSIPDIHYCEVNGLEKKDQGGIDQTLSVLTQKQLFTSSFLAVNFKS